MLNAKIYSEVDPALIDGDLEQRRQGELVAEPEVVDPAHEVDELMRVAGREAGVHLVPVAIDLDRGLGGQV